jgi:hypothetical protein
MYDVRDFRTAYIKPRTSYIFYFKDCSISVMTFNARS